MVYFLMRYDVRGQIPVDTEPYFFTSAGWDFSKYTISSFWSFLIISCSVANAVIICCSFKLVWWKDLERNRKPKLSIISVFVKDPYSGLHRIEKCCPATARTYFDRSLPLTLLEPGLMTSFGWPLSQNFNASNAIPAEKNPKFGS